MKAQSVRRILTLASGALALGLAATGAYWFLQVRPAAAAPPKQPAWVEKSYETYKYEKKVVKPADVWPVTLEELKKHITRPDLMSPESGIGVWPYVGPLPPAPRPKEKPTEAPKLPTGIESLGKLDAVIGLSADGLHGAYRWVYKPQGAPKEKYFWFMIGDFVHESDVDKDAKKGRFRVTKVARPDPAQLTFVATYDVYDDPEKKPVETGKTATFNLSPEGKAVIPLVKPPTAVAEAGKPGTATPGAAPGPGVGSTTPVFRPTVVSPTDNSRVVTFDDAETYRSFTETGVEKMIQEIKTEEAKDKGGQPIGIRLVSGLGDKSDLAKFDIQAGDILKSINGQPTHSRSQAIDIVKKLPKDTATVTAVVERNGRDIVYTVDPRDPEVRKAAGKLKTR
jgi:hypothetical protein